MEKINQQIREFVLKNSTKLKLYGLYNLILLATSIYVKFSNNHEETSQIIMMAAMFVGICLLFLYNDYQQGWTSLVELLFWLIPLSIPIVVLLVFGYAPLMVVILIIAVFLVMLFSL